MNANINYDVKISPAEAAIWGESRETDPVVAAAIHSIATPNRSAQAIWESPTSAEFDKVEMAVQSFISAGLYEANEDGRYDWGSMICSVRAMERPAGWWRMMTSYITIG